MASLFTAPQFDGGNGIIPEDGLQLFFFVEGTSTPKDTFTTEALDIENTNPVVSDANGVFPEIWMAESSRYKVRLEDKTDVLAGFGVVEIYIAGVTTDPEISANAELNSRIDRLNPDTLPIAVADIRIVDGDALNVEERTTNNGGGAIWNVVLASTVTPNTYNIVQCTGVATLALVLNTGPRLDMSQVLTSTDISAASTAMIAEGFTHLYFPAGSYIGTAQVDYLADLVRTPGIKITGDGIEKTIFDNQVANGVLFNINQDSASKFHLGTELSGFSIIQTTAPVVSGGIQIRAAFFTDIQDVYIDGLTGVGIKVLNSESLDTDQNVHFGIRRCEIRNTDDWGIEFDYTTAAAAGYIVERNRILNCTGALKLAAATGIVQLNGFAESVTNPQVLVAHNGLANNYALNINNNFFEKGRAGELRIDGLGGGTVSNNNFTSNDASSGPFAIKFGYDQRVNDVTLYGNRHIVNATAAATYSVYDIGDNAVNNAVEHPIFNDISTATKFNFENSTAGNNGNVLQDNGGEFLHTQPLKRNVVTPAAGFAIISLVEGAFVVLNVTATGGTVLSTPPNGAKGGGRFVLRIENNSGGSITVTTGSAFEFKGYSDPSAGGTTCAEFIRDSGAAKWIQIGSWS